MRILLLLIPTLLIQGCAGGLMAGNYTKTVATNTETGEVLKGRLGQPLYDTTRTARSVAIMETVDSLPSEPPANPCGDPMPVAVLEKIGSNAASEYFRSRSDCQRMNMMSKIVGMATGRPTTAAGEVAREKQIAVAHSEKGMTDRIKSITQPLGQVGIAKVIVGGYEKASDNQAKVGVAAAQNGNTTVENLNVGPTQSASGGPATSNDGESGLASSDGLPGSTSGSGVGGGSSNTSDVGTTVVTLGNNNSVGFSQDSGRAFVDTRSTQQLDTSANGGVNDDTNVDVQPIIDNQSDSTINNDPENGSNNSLF